MTFKTPLRAIHYTQVTRITKHYNRGICKFTLTLYYSFFILHFITFLHQTTLPTWLEVLAPNLVRCSAVTSKPNTQRKQMCRVPLSLSFEGPQVVADLTEAFRFRSSLVGRLPLTDGTITTTKFAKWAFTAPETEDMCTPACWQHLGHLHWSTSALCHCTCVWLTQFLRGDRRSLALHIRNPETHFSPLLLHATSELDKQTSCQKQSVLTRISKVI